MGAKQEVLLPDIGDFADVDVAEVLVAKGQRVAAEQSLIVLETDKASMEIPSPVAGVVVEIKVSVGDRVSEGAQIAIIEADEAESAAPPEPAKPTESAKPAEVPKPAAEPPKPTPEPIAARAETPQPVDPSLLVPREPAAPAEDED